MVYVTSDTTDFLLATLMGDESYVEVLNTKQKSENTLAPDK